MTDLLYTKVAKTLKDTSFAPMAFLALTALMVVFTSMLVEDYMTSVRGYASFPSAKVFAIVIWLVAALPQLFQMVTIYIIVGFSKIPKSERLFYGMDVIAMAVLAYIAGWLVDGYWDYTYKITGYTDLGILAGWGGIYWEVVLEAFGLYGIGSEVFSTIFGGVWVAMLREGASKDLADLVFEILRAIGDWIESALSFIVEWIEKMFNFFSSTFNSILTGIGVKEKKEPRRPPTNRKH